MQLQESTLSELNLGVKVNQNVAQYPPHHATYVPAKFQVARSSGLEDKHLQENTLYSIYFGSR